MTDSQDLTVQAQHPLMRVDAETGEVAVVDAQPYRGIAIARFSADQEAILSAPIPDEDHDILPTGEIYVSQVRYRRILNDAFGPGGWALMARTPLIVRDNILYREYALFAEGRFIAEAVGEQEYIANNPRMTYATAAEAVKSNALVRCCKDLLIASECWDRHFTEKFKEDFCERYYDKRKGKYFWRRKGTAPEAEDSGGGQGDRKASGRGGGRGETQTERPSVPTPPARPGPDDPASREARATFWKTCKGRLGEEKAKEWIGVELEALGVNDTALLKVGQIAMLYQKLAEVPEPAPEPQPDAPPAGAEAEPDIPY